MRMENLMPGNVRYLKDRAAAESEKITLNLGYVDLGRIDLLVREGFYSNRTDLIRSAIRTHLDKHAADLKRSVVRHTMDVGLRDFGRGELEAVRTSGKKLEIRVVGLARIARDVSPELALATIGSITVLGALQASDEVKAALAGRIA
jgi:Arc/MetJ-type ribon-helix-helix transcriptional regulator